MRFLLDTNILIPLEDDRLVLAPSLANFMRLAAANGHQVVFHPASRRDIERDNNLERRRRTLREIEVYNELDAPPACPWNTPDTDPNDAVDNEILYALERHAASGLITEDRGIHRKATARNLAHRVYYIQTAEDFLLRLHSRTPVRLPNIQEVPLYSIDVMGAFFDSLRAGYDGFDAWFARKAEAGTRAWIYGQEANHPQAICIYDIQTNEIITDQGDRLAGQALKLCTFKVGEDVRGKKIGELFLKAAFRYATDNRLENIFITARPGEQPFLLDLLEDFGFTSRGIHRGDEVFVKEHPVNAPVQPELEAFDYNRLFFPHYRSDETVGKFLVPIKPRYHDILFPDYGHTQGDLFEDNIATATVGNAIKLAYLCHARTNSIQVGDILLFYRSEDIRALTSVGIVERFEISDDEDEIAGIVSRRTVYNMDEIRDLAERPTKVILFRLVGHFPRRITHQWLITNEVVKGNIQSIWGIGDGQFQTVIGHAST